MSRPIVLFVVLGALLLALGSALAHRLGRPERRPRRRQHATAPSSPATARGEPVAARSCPIRSPTASRGSSSPPTPAAPHLVKPDGTGSHDILARLARPRQRPGLVVRRPPDRRSKGTATQGSQVWVANADGTGHGSSRPRRRAAPINAARRVSSPPGRLMDSRSPISSVTHISGGFTEGRPGGRSMSRPAPRPDLYTHPRLVSSSRPSWSPDGRADRARDRPRSEGTPEAPRPRSSVIGVVTVDGADLAPEDDHEPGAPGRLCDVASDATTSSSSAPTASTLDTSHRCTTRPRRRTCTRSSRDGTGLTGRDPQHRSAGAIVRAPTWTSDGRASCSRSWPTHRSDGAAPRSIEPSGTGEASATGRSIPSGGPLATRRPRTLASVSTWCARSSDRAHPVVLGVVRQLDQPERLEQRRQVHPEPAAVALAQAVPAADRVVLGPAPALDRAVLGRLLLVGCAQVDPVALRLEPGVQVVDRRRWYLSCVEPTWQTSAGGRPPRRATSGSRTCLAPS